MPLKCKVTHHNVFFFQLLGQIALQMALSEKEMAWGTLNM